MATNIETLKKPNGDKVLPRTRAKAVSMENGTTVEAAIIDINEQLKTCPDANSVVSINQQSLTDAQKAQVRANIGVNTGPDIHAEYFTITDDGIVSLKPEYRGAVATAFNVDGDASVSDEGVGIAGSKNARLPKHLIIPDAVNGIEVTGIAPGAFLYNHMIESIYIPSAVTVIPARCFLHAKNLHDVYSTTQVTEICDSAFYETNIKDAEFPNLAILGESVFYVCYNLLTANIGNVTSLPKKTFMGCYSLYRITGGLGVTTVGLAACMCTNKLTHAEFVGENLTEVKGGAFLNSGFVYDWNSLAGCSFGSYSISAQPAGTADFWSGLSIKQCENPIPTIIYKSDYRWLTKTIGNSTTKYTAGCLFMAVMHAYCGLNGLRLETVDELESIVNALSPNSDVLATFNANGFKWIDTIAPVLGLRVETYNQYNATSLQALYDALAEGKYAIAPYGIYPDYLDTESSSYNSKYEKYATLGHAVTIHGVRADGRLLIADSGIPEVVDGKQAARYALPYQAFIHPNSVTAYGCDSLYILSKAD
jgi:hypothetical protein